MNQKEFSPCHYALHFRCHSPVDCQSAYPLYASLLEKAPSSVAEKLHEEGLAPMSQFLQITSEEVIWHINLFSPYLLEHLAPILESEIEFALRNKRITLVVKSVEKSSIPSVEEFFKIATDHAGKHPVQVCTPTAFKSRGNYISLPTSHLVLQNLIKKWNVCYPKAVIELEDEESLQALAQGLWIHQFQIQSQSYLLKGKNISGFVGELTFTNHLKGMQRQVVDVLLLFAPYAGIGIKTTLGMGGLVLVEKRK